MEGGKPCEELKEIAKTNGKAVSRIGDDLNLPDKEWETEEIINHQYPLSINTAF